MSNEQAETRYPIGQSVPVVSLLQRRTPHDSASFLLPHLFDTMHLLDVGCGPGSITAGFKKLHPGAKVIGVDKDESIIDIAKEQNQGNGVTYLVAKITELPFDDNSFDVVFSHNVFQYLENVPLAVRETRRVLRNDEILATRQALSRHCVASPRGTTAFMEIFSKYLEEESGGNCNVGEDLPLQALAVGFRRVDPKASCRMDVGTRRRDFASFWIDMLRHGELGKRMVERGFAKEEELDEFVTQWKLVRDCEAGFIMAPHLEMLAWK